MRSLLVLAGLGLLGWIGLAVGFAVASGQAFFSYLVAWLFVVTLAIGALAFVMIGNAAQATWFVVIRRIPEALAAVFPLLLVLLLPVVVGLRRLYSWAAPSDAWSAEVAAAVEPKHVWLAPGFWIARAVFYVVVWAFTAHLIRRRSLLQDRDPRPLHGERMRAISAGFLPVLALSVTFAAFDWIMSLDPVWYSTTFGFYVFSGAFAGAVGLVTVLAWAAHRDALLPADGAPARTHAAGRLLFAFVIFWAYIGFTQLLIIWIADIPAETRFYAARVRGTWASVSYFLVFGHFIVPFFVLLSRTLKRRAAELACVGGWLVFAHYVDLYWLVMPALHGDGLHPSWLDLAALLAVGGPTGAFALWRFRAASPIPLHDPELGEGLRYHSP